MTSALLKAAIFAISLVIQLWIAFYTEIFASVVSAQAFAILISYVIFYPTSVGVGLTRRQQLRLAGAGCIIALVSLVGTDVEVVATSAMVMVLALTYGTNLLVDGRLFEGARPRGPMAPLSIGIRAVSLGMPLLGAALGDWWSVVLAYAIHAISNLALLFKGLETARAESAAPAPGGRGQVASGVLRILSVNAEIYGLQLASVENKAFLESIGYGKLLANVVSAFVVPVVARRRIARFAKAITFFASISLLLACLSYAISVPYSLSIVAALSLVLIDLGTRMSRSMPARWVWAASVLSFALAISSPAHVAIVSVCKFALLGYIFVSVLRRHPANAA